MSPTVDVPIPEALLAIVTLPVAVPEEAGSNCTFKVAVWPGFRVAGNFIPDTEKPVPVTVAELTVTAAVPEDFSVMDCVAGEFTITLPKEMFVALRVSAELPPLSCNAKVLLTLPALAVRVTD